MMNVGLRMIRLLLLLLFFQGCESVRIHKIAEIRLAGIGYAGLNSQEYKSLFGFDSGRKETELPITFIKVSFESESDLMKLGKEHRFSPTTKFYPCNQSKTDASISSWVFVSDTSSKKSRNHDKVTDSLKKQRSYQYFVLIPFETDMFKSTEIVGVGSEIVKEILQSSGDLCMKMDGLYDTLVAGADLYQSNIITLPRKELIEIIETN